MWCLGRGGDCYVCMFTHSNTNIVQLLLIFFLKVLCGRFLSVILVTKVRHLYIHLFFYVFVLDSTYNVAGNAVLPNPSALRPAARFV